jgi:hypothetical protein
MHPRRAPRVEGSPGAEVVGKLPQPVLNLGAHREGAMNAVRPVGRSLLFAAPNAHVTGGTVEQPRWLRVERVVDPGLPPGIGTGSLGRNESRRDRGLHFRRLCWDQLEFHDVQIIVLAKRSPIRGI